MHFGIIIMLNLGIGLVTPPVGTTLFVGCAIGKIPIDQAARGLWPFWIAMFVVLMLVTYFEPIAMTVPRLGGILSTSFPTLLSFAYGVPSSPLISRRSLDEGMSRQRRIFALSAIAAFMTFGAPVMASDRTDEDVLEAIW